MSTNGHSGNTGTGAGRADEVDDLLKAVQALIVPFIRSADQDAPPTASSTPNDAPRTTLVEPHAPSKLVQLLDFNLPDTGKGKAGLLATVEQILKYSVNTWDQGFLDKLYASTNAVGVISELLLAVLNTNLHVYNVSPALTVIEKTTARQLAGLFGFTGPHAGGISTQGGSASNMTSLIVARNTLFPSTKTEGNGSHNFVLFTSLHGHYSLEKAAQACGLGSAAVISVPVDAAGCMDPVSLSSLIRASKDEGKTPFYVNATAGTTVLGSYDPFEALSHVCKEYGLWLHIDGSWGAPVIFSPSLKYKMNGSHLADSLAVNPHKMMGVPITCSFLLTPDLRVFHRANTLPAGYLFHSPEDEDDNNTTTTTTENTDSDPEIWDLADLTLQCGRRGDSLKLALSWIYNGTSGFTTQIEHAFSIASYFTSLLSNDKNFILVSTNPPPCLQVCFYYAPDGNLGSEEDVVERNTRRTKRVVAGLVKKGFMVDYAPGERGAFFRVVVNVATRRETVDRLVEAIGVVGREVEG